MAVTLIYETHSTTFDNETGQATGWLPGELSPQGVLDAQALGARRRDDAIAAVFSSDLRRAVQTATIAFDGTGIPLLLDWRLRETNYGDQNGMPTTVLHASRSAHAEKPYPIGESWREAAERTLECLRDIAKRFDGRRVVVIGHAAQRYLLRSMFEGMSLQEAMEAPFEWQEGWKYEFSAAPDGEDA
jgi:2,3-bisphosphoglycerate-dependent phosphoglycerate mutase